MKPKVRRFLAFSPEDRAFLVNQRKKDPACDEVFKEIEQLCRDFPGSTLTYLACADRTWGEKMKPIEPNFSAQTIPFDSKKSRSSMTQNQRRTSRAIYKE